MGVSVVGRLTHLKGIRQRTDADGQARHCIPHAGVWGWGWYVWEWVEKDSAQMQTLKQDTIVSKIKIKVRSMGVKGQLGACTLCCLLPPHILSTSHRAHTHSQLLDNKKAEDYQLHFPVSVKLRPHLFTANSFSQLLDNKKAEDYQLPMPVSVMLRPYQQEGINWLAFLRRFGLHGVLADDMVSVSEVLIKFSGIYNCEHASNGLPSYEDLGCMGCWQMTGWV